MTAQYAQAGEGIGETRMQSLSVTRSRLEQIEADLKETRRPALWTLPKLVATREQLQQSLVRAPATGQVVGLQVFTVGGVVSAGQAVGHRPDGKHSSSSPLAPTDADDAYPGQAQIRFLSVHAISCRWTVRCALYPRTASRTKRRVTSSVRRSSFRKRR